MRKIIILIFFILMVFSLLMPLITAKQLSMKLLSVGEIEGEKRGSIANLHIEARQGSGRVFIDTFPLTQLDTQISTRFAKETACKFLNRNCNYVDFFYTLRSDSPLLGGPSAGASIAVITAALIENLDLDEKTAMTGTINSGGIIGQVSGIKYKIDAAFNNGIEKVILPYGKSSYTINYKDGNETKNKTIDFVEYGKDLGIEVVYVKNLNEALYEFTGKKYEKNNFEIEIPDFYLKTMKSITDKLCNNSLYYYKIYKEFDFNNTKINFSNNSIDFLKKGLELVNQSLIAYNNSFYYSAASLCFGANIRFNYVNLIENYNISDKEYLLKKLDNLKLNVKEKMIFLDDYNLETINDLQAFMVVRERLLETNEQIKLANKAIEDENFDSFVYRLAFAKERFNTAKYWSEFFNLEGKNLNLDDRLLRESCIRKISETQERIEYVRLSFPMLDFSSYYDGLSQARLDLRNFEYALCLFKASKTKAEIDLFISAVGSKNLTTFLDAKLEISKSIISKQKESGLFPILGYSYFEYANFLRDDDVSSSLLYSEYALELSDLDIYFGVKGRPYFIIEWNVFIFFALGLFSGISITILIYRHNKKVKKKLNKNPRKIPKGTFPGKKR
ncbi:MAG: S16 family serine protease [Candidatus Woesearchaeota archaeon]